jgi:hypothetical protein
MSRTRIAFRAALALPFAATVTGCFDAPRDTPPVPTPALATAADSLAARIVDAAGGIAALEALPALRFDFVVMRDSAESSRNRHLWDRRAGRHRIEWTAGDSLLVALFDSEGATDGVPRNGQVYLEGAPLDSAGARTRLEEAYRRFINDMYWLLAPLKLFDSGVSRDLAPDSADTATEVLTLSFAGVGLTPGDRYWMRADRDTGRIVSWSYVLQSGRTGTYSWTDPWELETPAGRLSLPARKTSRSGTGAIVTLVAPAQLDTASFTDPHPRLTSLP